MYISSNWDSKMFNIVYFKQIIIVIFFLCVLVKGSMVAQWLAHCSLVLKVGGSFPTHGEEKFGHWRDDT